MYIITAVETVIEKIKRRRLEWFGRVERMEGKRPPNAALHVRGDRSRGRQRKRWMDNIREDLEDKQKKKSIHQLIRNKSH